MLKTLDSPSLKGDAGIPGLNRKEVYEKHKILLPPLVVQKEIVAEIEEYQARIEMLKQEITEREDKIKTVIHRVWGEAS